MAKILIADDQPCVRELLSEELISEGYRVATAGKARQRKSTIVGRKEISSWHQILKSPFTETATIWS